MITQQSLAFDKRDKIENSEEYKSLEEQEAKLIADIEAFKDALNSAQDDLTALRKKLRFFRKKAGTHEKVHHTIYNYVMNNTDPRHSDIVGYLEILGHSSGTASAHVIQARQKGVIIENDDGTYTAGRLKSNRPRGQLKEAMFEYASSKDWFTIKECYSYIKVICVNVAQSNMQAMLASKTYKNCFEVDSSGKYNKYRLKNEYRSL
jgi:hypothetical protein